MVNRLQHGNTGVHVKIAALSVYPGAGAEHSLALEEELRPRSSRASSLP
jgi:hypothetical protein